jgi:hypothetical protein
MHASYAPMQVDMTTHEVHVWHDPEASHASTPLLDELALTLAVVATELSALDTSVLVTLIDVDGAETLETALVDAAAIVEPATSVVSPPPSPSASITVNAAPRAQPTASTTVAAPLSAA